MVNPALSLSECTYKPLFSLLPRQNELTLLDPAFSLSPLSPRSEWLPLWPRQGEREGRTKPTPFLSRSSRESLRERASERASEEARWMSAGFIKNRCSIVEKNTF